MLWSPEMGGGRRGGDCSQTQGMPVQIRSIFFWCLVCGPGTRTGVWGIPGVGDQKGECFQGYFIIIVCTGRVIHNLMIILELGLPNQK